MNLNKVFTYIETFHSNNRCLCCLSNEIPMPSSSSSITEAFTPLGSTIYENDKCNSCINKCRCCELGNKTRLGKFNNSCDNCKIIQEEEVIRSYPGKPKKFTISDEAKSIAFTSLYFPPGGIVASAGALYRKFFDKEKKAKEEKYKKDHKSSLEKQELFKIDKSKNLFLAVEELNKDQNFIDYLFSYSNTKKDYCNLCQNPTIFINKFNSDLICTFCRKYGIENESISTRVLLYPYLYRARDHVRGNFENRLIVNKPVYEEIIGIEESVSYRGFGAYVDEIPVIRESDMTCKDIFFDNNMKLKLPYLKDGMNMDEGNFVYDKISYIDYFKDKDIDGRLTACLIEFISQVLNMEELFLKLLVTADINYNH